jgi:predicted MFS family arabinose efflux permease
MWFAAFIGPIAAGILISSFETTIGAVGPSTTVIQRINTEGIGVALAVNAVSFLISIITLFMLRPPSIERASFGAARQEVNGIQSLKTIFDEIRGSSIFALLLAVNFLAAGPFFVGIPVLAGSRFDDGVTDFGILMGVFGLGMLLGTLLGQRSPNLAAGSRGWLLLILLAVQGVKFIALGVINAMIPAAIIVFLGSIALGYLLLVGIAWMQQTARSLYYAAIALAYPLSALLGGILVDLSLKASFIGIGLLLILALVAAPLTSFLSMMPPSEAIDDERLREARRRMPHEELKAIR